MVNREDLVPRIQAGERELIPELWAQVRRLVLHMAHKRLRATNGAGGVTLDDLMQAGFLGFLEAVRAYDPSAGFRFTSYLTYPVKTAFSEAEGRRSEKQKRDPIFFSVSIDVPLDEREGEPLTLADVIPDPQAEEAVEHVGAWDPLHKAVDGLPGAQRVVILRRYWLEQTTAEIAAATGQTEKEVRKLEAKAIRALRHPSISRALR